MTSNPWGELRQFTSARIALGRAGISLPTQPHLAFQLAHARARVAVHREADFTALRSALQALGPEVHLLHSAAATRPIYLQRPDLGRRLDDASAAALGGGVGGESSGSLSGSLSGAPDGVARGRPGPDVVFVIGDGLSSLAIEANAAPFLGAVLPGLQQAGWRVGPMALVRNARVAIGDEIGERLGAALVVVLIGERPGLSSPDSMGIYLSWQPRVGLTDEARNCISNVRAQGLSYPVAAHKLRYLMEQARQRGHSGVSLKDESDAPGPGLTSETRAGRAHFLLEGEAEGQSHLVPAPAPTPAPAPAEGQEGDPSR